MTFIEKRTAAGLILPEQNHNDWAKIHWQNQHLLGWMLAAQNGGSRLLSGLLQAGQLQGVQVSFVLRDGSRKIKSFADTAIAHNGNRQIYFADYASGNILAQDLEAFAQSGYTEEKFPLLHLGSQIVDAFSVPVTYQEFEEWIAPRPAQSANELDQSFTLVVGSALEVAQGKATHGINSLPALNASDRILLLEGNHGLTSALDLPCSVHAANKNAVLDLADPAASLTLSGDFQRSRLFLVNAPVDSLVLDAEQGDLSFHLGSGCDPHALDYRGNGCKIEKLGVYRSDFMPIGSLSMHDDSWTDNKSIPGWYECKGGVVPDDGRGAAGQSLPDLGTTTLSNRSIGAAARRVKWIIRMA